MPWTPPAMPPGETVEEVREATGGAAEAARDATGGALDKVREGTAAAVDSTRRGAEHVWEETRDGSKRHLEASEAPKAAEVVEHRQAGRQGCPGRCPREAVVSCGGSWRENQAKNGAETGNE